MQCKICHHSMACQFHTRILAKYDVAYYYCENCGYTCTEHPYWLDEAYSDAIVAADTGVLLRNRDIAVRLASFFKWVTKEDREARWLDYAGGYGILTRMMRDYGYNFYWQDPYSKNLFARGFEYAGTKDCRGVTAIECIEHVIDPNQFVSETLTISGAEILIFTTETFSGPPPAPEDWGYYAPNFGQHISFFQERTLKALARKFDLNYLRANPFHIFSRSALPALRTTIATGRAAVVADPLVRRLTQSRVLSDHDDRLRASVRGS